MKNDGMTNDELPDGWITAPLSEVVDVLDSKRIPINADERERRVKGKNPQDLIPYYGATGQVGFIDEALFDEPLILLGEDGVPFYDPLKHKAYRVSGKTWVNNHAHVLRARTTMCDERFITAFLNSFDYTGYVTGSTRLKLTQGSMNSIPVSLAPLAEQKRIADKLEAVLGRVDACRARLDRVPDLLKRFRQSVLAAATSGQLTEDWREEHSSSEWRAVTLEDVSNDFSYGSSAKSSPTGRVPVLRMGNIQEGRLDWADLVYTSDTDEIEKYQLKAGDVLFNRTNSPELVGKTAVFKGERPAIYAGYLIRVQCSESLLPDYLNYCLNSPSGRDYCWQVKTDGVSQSNINAKKLAAFGFDLPPLAEQAEIVRRVEALFALAERIEARLATAQRLVERLTPATLSKAFRGDLVPQAPNDEPARVLLERLGQQTSFNVKPRTRRTSRFNTQ